MSRQPELFTTLFAKIGWVVSKESNGFDVYSVPDGTLLKQRPNSWKSNASDDFVFIDGVSFEEENIHLISLRYISSFLDFMIENKSKCVLFPVGTSRDLMINSILETFPGKYAEQDLIKKRFICSNGYRKSREY